MLDIRDGVVRNVEGPAGQGWYRFAPWLRGEGTRPRRAWRGLYVRRTILADAMCAAAAAGLAYWLRFGAPNVGELRESFIAALAMPWVWVLAVLVARGYEQRFLWIGPEEFRRVSTAAVVLMAVIATAAWGFKLDVARGFIVVAVPLTGLLALGCRYARRRWLHRERGRGRFQSTTLLVGHRSAVAALDEQIDRAAYHGYRVVGCCLPPHRDDAAADAFNGLPVLGDLHGVTDVVARYEVDAVAVLPCPELDGPALRRLGWDLERTQAELLLAPAVTEIAGPRIHIRPVCGLPLMHMERPELRGIRRLAKAVTDWVLAALVVLFIAPVLAAVAVAIKVTSSGPVLFEQERVGRDGQTFKMLKFRSMVVGADRMVGELADESDGNGVLFKKKDDPRITSVGRLMRRYSIDELPQLFNVLRGEMSLVGPRPPLPSEVDQYGFDMHRRFLVKPGLTGLWQVSGRSDLSWDESVRLDVRYVENWSFAFDLMILWKTVGAVLRGSGAY